MARPRECPVPRRRSEPQNGQGISPSCPTTQAAGPRGRPLEPSTIAGVIRVAVTELSPCGPHLHPDQRSAIPGVIAARVGYATRRRRQSPDHNPCNRHDRAKSYTIHRSSPFERRVSKTEQGPRPCVSQQPACYQGGRACARSERIPRDAHRKRRPTEKPTRLTIALTLLPQARSTTVTMKGQSLIVARLVKSYVA